MNSNVSQLSMLQSKCTMLFTSVSLIFLVTSKFPTCFTSVSPGVHGISWSQPHFAPLKSTSANEKFRPNAWVSLLKPCHGRPPSRWSPAFCKRWRSCARAPSPRRHRPGRCHGSFVAGKIKEKWWIFRQAMFDYRRVWQFKCKKRKKW